MKYRVCVSRTGSARHLSHLAQIETLRRAVEKASLPVALDARRKRSRPRLSFGPAISVGHESFAEYFDLELIASRTQNQVASALVSALTEGFALREVRRIPVYFPSLDASINVVRYEISGPYPADSARSLGEFLGRREIIIEKLKDGGARVELIDARPLILKMEMTAPDCLSLLMRFGPGRTVKPEALLREWLKCGLESFRILRKELLSETSGGEFLKP